MNPSFSKDYFRIKGVNAEKLVADLATKTFLIDWCFLNPKLPDGKELCDLLVIFDDVAIIWQIKDLKLDKNGKYKKAEVDKNLRQLAGARRQLFDLKTPVCLQNARRREEIFDSSNFKEIFLISVLLGEGEEYFSFIDEIKNNKVHVFTRDFTQIILNELDTISDFIEYLKAKELFVDAKKSLVIIGGEEEFLAFYLTSGRNFERLDKTDHVILDGTCWKGLQSRLEYKAKKEADKISYGWDSIINRAHEGTEKYEIVARELARTTRFQRRYLSKTFFEAHVLAHKNSVHDLFRRVMPGEGVTYCFLFQEDQEPRNKRKAMLTAMCWIGRGKFKENKKVIGIATEMKIRPTCSFDFLFLNVPGLDAESQKKIEQFQKDMGIFVNPIVRHASEDEYPQVG